MTTKVYCSGGCGKVLPESEFPDFNKPNSNLVCRICADEIKRDVCRHCKKRPATMDWVGHGGYAAIGRAGWMTRWCDICALEAQITFAEERAAEIPKMREELEKLRRKENGA